jgi:hypothetical protein
MNKKNQLIQNLIEFINQRPGLEFGNYGDVTLYRAESRAITKQKTQAMELLNFVARTESIDLTSMLWEMQPKDRLAVTPETLSIEYTAGQYFPTEYRAAVRSALRNVIWNWAREHAECNTREKIQAFAKRNFSRSVAKLFN